MITSKSSALHSESQNSGRSEGFFTSSNKKYSVQNDKYFLTDVLLKCSRDSTSRLNCNNEKTGIVGDVFKIIFDYTKYGKGPEEPGRIQKCYERNWKMVADILQEPSLESIELMDDPTSRLSFSNFNSANVANIWDTIIGFTLPVKNLYDVNLDRRARLATPDLLEKYCERSWKLKSRVLCNPTVHRSILISSQDVRIRCLNPFKFVVAANRTLYVTDNDRGKIYNITYSGVLVNVIEDLSRPTKVLLNSKGNLLVIEHGKPNLLSTNSVINIYSPEGKKLGSIMGDPSQKHPWSVRDISIDHNDNVYALDGYNHTVKVFDEELNLVKEFGSKGDASGKLIKPQSLVVDAVNRLVYVADQPDLMEWRIQIFSFEGKLQGGFCQAGQLDQTNFFLRPIDFQAIRNLTLDVDGNIIIADRHTTQVFTPCGTKILKIDFKEKFLPMHVTPSGEIFGVKNHNDIVSINQY